AYVRGKFRIKKWGRNKIILGLLQKKISNKLINEAIHREIEEEEYLQMINELIDKKIQLINESDELKKRDKIYRYLISKGYESELVANELNSI
ncbi:MAG: RecX family transcriptional regulator, partial [Flavobacteriales bacterium CG_4_9_14_3_um_filter_32_8]